MFPHVMNNFRNYCILVHLKNVLQDIHFQNIIFFTYINLYDLCSLMFCSVEMWICIYLFVWYCYHCIFQEEAINHKNYPKVWTLYFHFLIRTNFIFIFHSKFHWDTGAHAHKMHFLNESIQNSSLIRKQIK